MNARREYIFIACLIFLAVILFGWGSRAGLALQVALRGTAPDPGAPESAETDSKVLDAYGGISVPVYSQYPFNLKNELAIAAGTADGINTGDAALAEGYLVGVVAETGERSATVRTIFDSRFQLPVRIGPEAADALLRGGNDPQLILIAVAAPVGEGNEVRSAASGMPYGLPLGSLRGLHDASDKVFREASLQAPYNPGNLNRITVIPYSGR